MKGVELLAKKIFRKCPTPDIACDKCQWSNSCPRITLHGMLVDCKAFYYVYDWLAQGNKMPIYDGNQEKFEADMESHLNRQLGRPFLQIPQWTNGAFAAELALKFLFAREGKSYGNIHNLKDLFYSLPEIHRTTLLHRIKTQAHQSERALEIQLSDFSNAFAQSRYFFEYGSFGFSGLFDSFVKIICEYAFEFDDQDDFEIECGSV